MDEMIFFDNAKDNVTNFFEKEFVNFPPLLMSHFLNKFNDILNTQKRVQSYNQKLFLQITLNQLFVQFLKQTQCQFLKTMMQPSLT